MWDVERIKSRIKAKLAEIKRDFETEPKSILEAVEKIGEAHLTGNADSFARVLRKSNALIPRYLFDAVQQIRFGNLEKTKEVVEDGEMIIIPEKCFVKGDRKYLQKMGMIYHPDDFSFSLSVSEHVVDPRDGSAFDTIMVVWGRSVVSPKIESIKLTRIYPDQTEEVVTSWKNNKIRGLKIGGSAVALP